MGVNRVFRVFFNPKILDEEALVAKEKTFDEILQEEYAKLIQLVSEAQAKGTVENFYKNYNPGMSDRMVFEE